MNTAAANRLKHIGYLLAVGISTFLVDAAVVATLWASGVDFQIYTQVLPGSPGYQELPMSAGYKCLLLLVLALNAGLLYLLMRQWRRLVWAFVAGAFVPMSYLVYVLFTA